ncbi:YggT family protein [Pseudonocardia sichuanensis]|uniref:YggT family protein n=1 Tax=Pseudonocardia kunmingensis TaxID=630975 RepID=A0A543DLI9_9PSEU|nr:YggT family protein [Pseudonocardia kunmingensis]TQM10210.1 YggT family protein [Pseudonocardia kunmingensis]
MSAVGTLLGTLLLLFQLVLVARAVVDWVAALSSGPEPGWRSTARRVTHAATEPVLAPVRRVLPPLRAGSVGIDLAFIVVFVATVLLRLVVTSF